MLIIKKIEKLEGEEDIGIKILQIFAKSNDKSLQLAVAKNSYASNEILKNLLDSNESGYEVRQAIAENKNSSQDMLKKLIKDDDDDVKEAAEKALKERGLLEDN